jgi:hypothetical protein
MNPGDLRLLDCSFARLGRRVNFESLSHDQKSDDGYRENHYAQNRPDGHCLTSAPIVERSDSDPECGQSAGEGDHQCEQASVATTQHMNRREGHCEKDSRHENRANGATSYCLHPFISSTRRIRYPSHHSSLSSWRKERKG